jgi:membrane dipeptidase
MKKYYSLLTIAFTLFGCEKKSLEQKAMEIHSRVITLDTHDDISVTNFTDSLNYTMDTKTQVNLPKMIEGGLDVGFFIVYTGQKTLDEEGYALAAENAISKFEAIHRLVSTYAPDKIELATTSEDVIRISSEGKLVAMIGVENAYPLGLDLTRVKNYHEKGARYMSLAHNGHSQFADSNTGEYDSIWMHDGLSELGGKLVKELNYYGIMIDLSHPSKEANRQTIALSKAPVIASHSSARALCDHPRNLDDEQLEWIKNNGGVVQTVALGSYLKAEKQKNYRVGLDSIIKVKAEVKGFKIMEYSDVIKLKEEYYLKYREGYVEIQKNAKSELKGLKEKYPPVNVSDFVDHIDYIKNKIGIDHVGISSDFDGGGGIEGWQDASETFNVTLELVKRGYSEEEISKIWSGNLLRVLDQVQEVSMQLQSSNN